MSEGGRGSYRKYEQINKGVRHIRRLEKKKREKKATALNPTSRIVCTAVHLSQH